LGGGTFHGSTMEHEKGSLLAHPPPDMPRSCERMTPEKAPTWIHRV